MHRAWLLIVYMSLGLLPVLLQRNWSWDLRWPSVFWSEPFDWLKQSWNHSILTCHHLKSVVLHQRWVPGHWKDVLFHWISVSSHSRSVSVHLRSVSTCWTIILLHWRPLSDRRIRPASLTSTGAWALRGDSRDLNHIGGRRDQWVCYSMIDDGSHSLRIVKVSMESSISWYLQGRILHDAPK